MRKADACIRQKLLQFRRALNDGLDAVVQIVDLPAAFEFALNRLHNKPLIVLKHEALHGVSVLRRLLDDTHVADARERHVERAGNRRCGEGQHVDAVKELLEPLLMRHAEALLLVDDRKPERAEFHVLREHTVRAD